MIFNDLSMTPVKDSCFLKHSGNCAFLGVSGIAVGRECYKTHNMEDANLVH